LRPVVFTLSGDGFPRGERRRKGRPTLEKIFQRRKHNPVVLFRVGAIEAYVNFGRGGAKKDHAGVVEAHSARDEALHKNEVLEKFGDQSGRSLEKNSNITPQRVFLKDC